HSDREMTTDSFNFYTTGGFSLFGRDHEVVLGYSYNKNDFLMYSTYASMPGYNYYRDRVVPPPDFTNPISYTGNDESQRQDGFYGTVRFSLTDSLKLMAGGRASSHQYHSVDVVNGTSGTNTGKNRITTPYFGVVYDLTDFASLYTSYTGIFLPVGQYGADGTLLDPTEGTNMEAGIKLAFFNNELNVAAAVYRSNKDNVAEFANMGMLPNGQWIYTSIDGVKTDGYEIEVSGSLTPQWNVNAGYTHNTAEDKSGAPRETYIPDDVFKFTSTYRFSGMLQGLTLGTSVAWQSATYYDSAIRVVDPEIPFRQKQNAYTLLDVMARYDLDDSLSLTLNVNNATDKFYNRSLWGYADYGEPRNVALSLRWQR
ncbi:MAG TPA: TonB-dependent receptor, partial [Hyphomicrobiales bacterium]|nr:TonB-dependent receptor [Hyphomicrobiales bacterium]